jgi:type II secretory pathway pseudopilin PulG
MSRERSHPARRFARSGFSMIEAVISCAIVGGLFAAAMSVAGAASERRRDIIDRSAAQGVVREFWAEISGKSFAPLENPPLPGRLGFNDVRDYEKYQQAPPRKADGTALPGAERLGVRVAVAGVRLSTLERDDSSEDLLEVTITVLRAGRTIAELSFLHSRAWTETFR